MAQLSSIMGVPKAASPARGGRGREEDKDLVAGCDRPWDSAVIVLREEICVTGTYGIGMGVDVPAGNAKVEKPFAVSKLTALKDPMGNDANSSVAVGDILCFCNDRSVAKEGGSIIESTIWGEQDSLLKLTFKNHAGQMYDRVVKRHVPIPGRTKEYTRKWYAVAEEMRGKELVTTAEIVESLNEARSTVIDAEGREMDFLAGIKKRGSSLGLALAPNSNLVEKVVAGSPAGLAGLRKGDAILEMDGASAPPALALALSANHRIGSVCKVVFGRGGGGGRREEATLARTQIAAMHRTEEVLEVIRESKSASAHPEGWEAMEGKVVELERERQYEERVMAGRLNKSHSELLGRLAEAAGTLQPPRIDLADAIAQLKQLNADLATTNLVLEKEVQQHKERLEREMRQASERDAELHNLHGEVARLREELQATVPRTDLHNAHNAEAAAKAERDALREELASMMPRAEHLKGKAELLGAAQELEAALRAATAAQHAAEEKGKVLEEEAEGARRAAAQASADKAKADKEALGLRAEAKTAKDRLASAEADALHLRQLLNDSQEEVGLLRPRAEADAAGRAALEAERFALGEEVAAAGQRLKDAEASAAHARRDAKAAKEEGDRLSSERDAAKRKAAAAEAAAKEAEQAHAGVKGKLRAAEDLAHALQTKLGAAERKLKEAQDDAADATARAKAAREAEVAARAALEAAQGQGQRSKQDKAGAEEHAARLQAELAEARAEALALTEKLLLATREAEEARLQLPPLHSLAEKLKAEANHAKQGEAEAEAKCNAVTKRLNVTEGALEGARGEVGAAKKEAQGATARAAALEEELKGAREKAALAAEQAKKAVADAAKATKSMREAQAALKSAQDQLEAGAGRMEAEAAAERLRLSQQAHRQVAALEGEAAEAAAALKAARALQAEAEGAAEEAGRRAKKQEEEARRERAKLMQEVEGARKAVAGGEEERKSLEKKMHQREEALKKLLATAEATAKEAAADAKKAKESEREAITAAAANGAEVQRFKVEGEKARAAAAALQHKVGEAEERAERAHGLAKRLLAPAFASERGPSFSPPATLTLTAPPGAVVYVQLAPSASRAPFSTASPDASGPAPLSVTVSESCVVRAAAWLEEEQLLSDVVEQEMIKKRVVPPPAPAAVRAAAPPPPQVKCGVGMLLHRERRGGAVTVGDIYEGGQVERDGRIRVGDLLLAVDGVACEAQSMDDVSDSISGLPGTEVVLRLERKGGEEGNPKGGGGGGGGAGGGFADSAHSLSGGGGGEFEVVLERKEEQVGVGMLLSRSEAREGREHGAPFDPLLHAIIVRELFEGGAAAAEASIQVGDILLSVDGTAVDKLDMDQVSELIVGPPNSEVELVLERKEARALSPAELLSQGCYRVVLNRQRRETIVKRPDSMGLSVLDSGKSLLSSLDFFNAPPQAT